MGWIKARRELVGARSADARGCSRLRLIRPHWSFPADRRTVDSSCSLCASSARDRNSSSSPGGNSRLSRSWRARRDGVRDRGARHRAAAELIGARAGAGFVSGHTISDSCVSDPPFSTGLCCKKKRNKKKKKKKKKKKRKKEEKERVKRERNGERRKTPVTPVSPLCCVTPARVRSAVACEYVAVGDAHARSRRRAITYIWS